MELVDNKKEAEPVPLPTKPKRSPWLIFGVVAVLILAIIGGYVLLTAGSEDTDDAQVAADLVPIATRVAGQVVRIAVKENQTVKKGDLIAQLDDADYTARVKQAEAELATAQAQAQAADAQVQVVDASAKGGLTSARAAVSGSSVGVGSAQAQVQAARASLERAETDLKKTEIDLQRARELKAANAIPQERLDNASMARDSAAAGLAQAKANLAMAEESRHLAEARVSEMRGRLSQSSPIEAQNAAARAQADLAHARVKSAEAQLDLQRLQLGYTRIVAPADGVASKLTAHEGQLLQPGQPVVELVPTGTYVIANFKETQVGKMRPGQKAKVRVDAYPGRTFEGTVESLSGGTGASFSLIPADNASGNFVKVVQRVPVRISWQPPADAAMRAGLSADVAVEVGR
jgi:membrane fusion protein (multidrug efflux system)